MYYGNIKKYDIADGLGVRVTLFCSGCTNHCEGCFQKETWDFRYGKLYTEDTEKKILDALNHPYIQGLTLLGGEPFEPENQRVLVTLLRKVRAEYPEKDIWSYTGFVYESLIQDEQRELLENLDVLVDGRFGLAEKG